MFKNFHNSL